ncbi:hypothetical protein BGZ99_008525 [Dissophora globulifera]|uniref:Uncharacterized protein n=1 Tax=Dissophora globulifera TaxID=979702 RepID=A0A9P6UPG4_9FUNG|nr:hypothetical protein BGZ99_008525 [Dissophora globulifera]
MEAVNDVDMVQAVNIDLKPLVGKFRATELTMGRFMALVHKFPEQYSLAERILKEEEAISVVEDGTERDCVYRLFKTGSVEATTITTTTAATTTAAPAPATAATKIATKTATGGAGVGAKAGAGSGSSVLHTERPFPKPSCREFVIETFDPSGPASSFGRGSVSMSMSMSGSSLGPIGSGGEGGTAPTWYARPLQRRMYACFKDSEVRIVEAIAKDGMFM